MRKYSLLFHNRIDCETAKQWIKGNIKDVKECDVSYGGNVLIFYRAVPLTKQQQDDIKDAVRPASFRED